MLGTYVSIELQGDFAEKLLNTYISKGFAAIAEIDRLMSFHRADSDLSRINQAPPHVWVDFISSLTLEVLRTSNHLFKITQGVFDIRCGGILSKWGILPAKKMERNRFLEFPDLLPLEIENGRVRKSGQWTFDLGGIAKGFAVDYAVKKIKGLARGLSGVINAGGDLRVWGPEETLINIKVPGKENVDLRAFKLKHTAVATSSVKASLRTLKRNRVSAYVKMPQQKPFQESKTVTVFAKECLWADALTKVVLLAPEDIALRSLSSFGARAMVFADNGQVQKTMG